jgi:hypothetical protein
MRILFSVSAIQAAMRAARFGVFVKERQTGYSPATSGKWKEEKASERP